MDNKILENLEKLKKMLVLLSEERKVVLSHHKTFEHVEKMVLNTIHQPNQLHLQQLSAATSSCSRRRGTACPRPMGPRLQKWDQKVP